MWEKREKYVHSISLKVEVLFWYFWFVLGFAKLYSCFCHWAEKALMKFSHDNLYKLAIVLKILASMILFHIYSDLIRGWKCIHTFLNCLLNVYYVPATVLHSGCRIKHCPCSQEVYGLKGETEKWHFNTLYSSNYHNKNTPIGYMYMCGWFTLLSYRNWHSSVKQLHYKRRNNVKEYWV